MRTKILIGITLFVTVAYWAVLIFRLPVFKLVPHYYWHAMKFTDKPLGNLWLVALIVAAAIVVIAVVWKRPERHLVNLLLLIVLGWGVQMSFGFMEDRGISGIRSRMWSAGHAEFAKITAHENNLYKCASRYEEMAEYNKENAPYLQTKPPGQLLVYMLTQKLSNIIAPEVDPKEKYIRLATFAAYFYPLLSYLVLIPLFYLGRMFVDDRAAVLGCILYLFVPGVTLVTMHLDQALYPLPVVLCLYLIARQSWVRAVLCGVVAYAAVYISFSLLPLFLLAPMFAAVVGFSHGEDKRKLKGIIRQIGGFVGGIVVAFLLFRIVLNYDPFIRYANAMAFHHTWKAWEPGVWNSVKFAVLNYIEYAFWIGIPIAAAYIVNAAGAVRRTVAKRPAAMDLLSVALLVVFLLVGFFSQTKGEVARLWIFLMPLVCLFAGRELYERFRGKLPQALGVVVGLQLVTIFLIKRFQDFW